MRFICPPFTWKKRGRMTVTRVSDSSDSGGPSKNQHIDREEIDLDKDEVRQMNGRRESIILVSEATSNQPLTNINYAKYEKDEKSVTLIKQALTANDFIKNLMDDERLNSVVEAMKLEQYKPNTFIIKEGEIGSHLYVSAEGQFEVIKNEKVLKKFGAGEAFGELAILYMAKRFASVKATVKSKVWVLEISVFQKIVIKSGRQEREDNVKFLSSVPLLNGIQHSDLVTISDFLRREFFVTGQKIVCQGDKGDQFYIIRGGTVTITKKPADGGPEELVKEMTRGEYFGEQALLHEDKRLATVTANAPGVECLVLDRVPFNDLLGQVDKLKERPEDPPSSNVIKPIVFKSEYDYIQLDELKKIGIMGIGAFGCVELVQYTQNVTLTFALKRLKKAEIVKQKQKFHVFNEKRIMVSCDSPFICRLYKTYKDSRYLYFLIEPLLGGDIWTALHKKQFFKEKSSRFMAACVVEAFEYLHKLNIIYRDLKPENLMLDYKGYIKLVDFGFAKFLPSGAKTYTFAGTPEYVAPEIVLSKGHDRAVDYWTLGILIYELITGKAPFRAANHMKTYTTILKGIDSVHFNPKISANVQDIIKKLCRQVPTERLGYLKNGINDIKNHKWFLDFDWNKLRERTMPAPLVRPIASNVDLSNFDIFTEEQVPPEETSGWDVDF